MSPTAKLAVTTPDRVDADLLILGCFEGAQPPVTGLPPEIRAAAERLAGRPGWKAADDRYAETQLELGQGPVRVVALQGLGDAAELSVRSLASLLTRSVCRGSLMGLTRVAVRLPEHPVTTDAGAAERLGRTLLLAGYRFERYLTDERLERPRLAMAQLLVPDAAPVPAGAVGAAEVVTRAIIATRELANTPANEADPAWMEERARELAGRFGMEITVLGPEELAERGMGGILAVGRGSRVHPRLVRLEWRGGDLPVSLVGKGVTFDTGGISIKPPTDMDEMKFDKCGACTVLGVAQAVAELGLPVHLRAYLPLAENMPDGAAYRPGDIVRCYNGKTVEILNTDAEGRMILADALAWAAEESPGLLLEYSTLTGAAVVALGEGAAGLFTPDDALAQGLLEAAEATGERLWRLPLWPEFVEQMKGAHADLRNSGGRWGGANTAAAFLSQFLEGHHRWAHLDIAGAAYVGNRSEEPKGATGYGVAFTVGHLRRLAG